MESCRLCLRSDVKMHRMVSSLQSNFIEQIFKLHGFYKDLNETDYACYMCMALLNKSYKFIQMTIDTQKVLNDPLYCEQKIPFPVNKPILSLEIEYFHNDIPPYNFHLDNINNEADYNSKTIIIDSDEEIDTSDVKAEVDSSEEEKSENINYCNTLDDKSSTVKFPELLEVEIEVNKNKRKSEKLYEDIDEFIPETVYKKASKCSVKEKSVAVRKSKSDTNNKSQKNTRKSKKLYEDSDEYIPETVYKKASKCSVKEKSVAVRKSKSDTNNKSQKNTRKSNKLYEDSDEYIPETVYKKASKCSVKEKSVAVRKSKSDTNNKSQKVKKRRRKRRSKKIKDNRDFPMECELCDGEISTKQEHYRHYMYEHPKETYPYGFKRVLCSTCGARVSKIHLDRHLQTHGDKKFKCHICSKKFTTKQIMLSHVRVTHSEPKLICDYCLKPFKVKSDIVRHIRTHTGEKPFKCHICDAAFAHSGNRALHIKSSHQNIKIVPKKTTTEKEENVSRKRKSRKNNLKMEN